MTRNSFLSINKNLRMAIIFSLSTLVLSQGGVAEEGEAQLTDFVRMAKSFQCSTLAEVAGEPEQSARLRLVGIEAGRSHLTNARDGELDETTEAFSGGSTLWGLDKHSIEFATGYYYGNFVSSTFDQIVEDQDGNFYFDEERVERAKQFFLEENCLLIR